MDLEHDLISKPDNYGFSMLIVQKDKAESCVTPDTAPLVYRRLIYSGGVSKFELRIHMGFRNFSPDQQKLAIKEAFSIKQQGDRVRYSVDVEDEQLAGYIAGLISSALSNK